MAKPNLYEEQRELKNGRMLHYYVEADINSENYNKLYDLCQAKRIDWNEVNKIPGIHRADFIDAKESIAKDCDVSLDDYIQNEYENLLAELGIEPVWI